MWFLSRLADLILCQTFKPLIKDVTKRSDGRIRMDKEVPVTQIMIHSEGVLRSHTLASRLRIDDV
jgi:hypothetical protein